MQKFTTNTGAGLSPAPISFSAKTVTVFVRHGETCKDKERAVMAKMPVPEGATVRIHPDVGLILRPERILRRGDARLVERYGQYLMLAVIAHVGDLEQPVV